MSSSSALALLGLAVVLALLLLPIPVGREDLWSTLENTGHPVLFALVGVSILVFFRSQIHGPGVRQRTVYVAACVCAIALGGATEILQLFTGRDASWIDFFNDAVGSVLGLTSLVLFEYRGKKLRGRWLFWGTSIVLVVVAVAPLAWSSAAYVNRKLEFPVVWQYRSALDLRFLDTACSRMTVRAAKPAAATFALERCAYAGFALLEPYPHWGNFRFFRIELSNPGERALKLTIRIQDYTHNWRFEDRFNQPFDIAPGGRAILRIPVDSIRHGAQTRLLDIERMSQIMVFANTPEGDERIVLHEMRLEY